MGVLSGTGEDFPVPHPIPRAGGQASWLSPSQPLQLIVSFLFEGTLPVLDALQHCAPESEMSFGSLTRPNAIVGRSSGGLEFTSTNHRITKEYGLVRALIAKREQDTQQHSVYKQESLSAVFLFEIEMWFAIHAWIIRLVPKIHLSLHTWS